ncbi:MAG: cytochrome c peroxidase [Lysobacterales bacterium]
MTAGKVALGKTLFWEEQLSQTGTVACGTCHRPDAGHSDPRTAIGGEQSTHPGPDGRLDTRADNILASPGVALHSRDGQHQPSALFGMAVQVGGRKSPPVTSAAYAPQLFWDGRATSSFRDPLSGEVLIINGGALESQSLAPLLDTSEMGHVGNTISDAVGRLNGVTPLALANDIPAALANWIGGRDYPSLFNEVFGTPAVTPARIAFALASYQRALNETTTPLDVELTGTPSLTVQERLGREVFAGMECDICHAGVLHTDNSFRYIGVRPVGDDLGRFALTGDAQDRGAFRTPSLRNVAARAPFMHNGGLATLEQVVDFYVRGGDFDAPNKDPLMHPRALDPARRQALLAYMRNALTDPRISAELPPFDRPTLFSESARVPQIVGAGVGGAAGVPVIGANEPPYSRNRKFTITVSGARPGATATLIVSRVDPGVHRTLPSGGVARIETDVQTGNAVSGGYASVQLNLASQPALAGETLFGRFYIDDPTAAGGLAVTRAFRIEVFGANAAVPALRQLRTELQDRFRPRP